MGKSPPFEKETIERSFVSFPASIPNSPSRNGGDPEKKNSLFGVERINKKRGDR
jgi:hypothetical protein